MFKKLSIVIALSIWAFSIHPGATTKANPKLKTQNPKPASVWRAPAKKTDAVRVLLVTGGHNHDADFYSVFADDGITTTVEPHPVAFTNDFRKQADVLVLYDMVKELEPAKQRNLRAFVESGKGVVVLHHALCGNVNWPWWYEEVVGGRYLFEKFEGKLSSYLHDQIVAVKPVGEHPILQGIAPFTIFDETYKDFWISPKVKPLLQTDNPTSEQTIAWISPYEKSRIVYIQLGHGRDAHLNPNYQHLVRNAIRWAAHQ